MRVKFKTYENGERRTITRFLWLPVIIENELRWLEYATTLQCYVKARGVRMTDNWLDISFVDKENPETINVKLKIEPGDLASALKLSER